MLNLGYLDEEMYPRLREPLFIMAEFLITNFFLPRKSLSLFILTYR